MAAEPVRCPKCQQRIVVDERLAGQQVRCPRCRSVFAPAQPAAVAASSGAASEPAPAPPQPAGLPTNIGVYEVKDKLGEGAFGVVYRAYQPQLDREVAIKALKAAALRSAKYLERFLREARVVGQMHHGNIVPVHDLLKIGDDY